MWIKKSVLVCWNISHFHIYTRQICWVLKAHEIRAWALFALFPCVCTHIYIFLPSNGLCTVKKQQRQWTKHTLSLSLYICVYKAIYSVSMCAQGRKALVNPPIHSPISFTISNNSLFLFFKKILIPQSFSLFFHQFFHNETKFSVQSILLFKSHYCSVNFFFFRFCWSWLTTDKMSIFAFFDPKIFHFFHLVFIFLTMCFNFFFSFWSVPESLRVIDRHSILNFNTKKK